MSDAIDIDVFAGLHMQQAPVDRPNRSAGSERRYLSTVTLWQRSDPSNESLSADKANGIGGEGSSKSSLEKGRSPSAYVLIVK